MKAQLVSLGLLLLASQTACGGGGGGTQGQLTATLIKPFASIDAIGSSSGVSLNENGDVVGSVDHNDGDAIISTPAVAYANGQAMTLDNYFFTVADINDSGQVLGYVLAGPNSVPGIFKDGQLQTLNPQKTLEQAIFGLGNDGSAAFCDSLNVSRDGGGCFLENLSGVSLNLQFALVASNRNSDVLLVDYTESVGNVVQIVDHTGALVSTFGPAFSDAGLAGVTIRNAFGMNAKREVVAELNVTDNVDFAILRAGQPVELLPNNSIDDSITPIGISNDGYVYGIKGGNSVVPFVYRKETGFIDLSAATQAAGCDFFYPVSMNSNHQMLGTCASKTSSVAALITLHGLN